MSDEEDVEVTSADDDALTVLVTRDQWAGAGLGRRGRRPGWFAHPPDDTTD